MKKFWSKNKKHIERFAIWFVVALVLFFAIPFFINWVYKIPAKLPIFAMSWEAKDVLAFYGSLLGSVATILALSETIRFTRKSQREERKLSIKPRLDSKWKDCTKSALDLSTEEGLIYIDYSKSGVSSSEKMPDVFTKLITISTQLQITSKSQGNVIDKQFLKLARDKANENYLNYIDNHCLILYEIYNYGANNAIDVEFKINDSLIAPPFCISVNEPKRFVLNLNNDIFGENGLNVKVKLTYTDICSMGKYEQKEFFSVFKVDSQFATTQAVEYKLSSPKDIK